MVEDTLEVGRHPEGLTLTVRVKPRARREGIEGVRDGVLQVALREPPLEGRANEALVRLLAKALELRRRQVRLLHGERSREKTVLPTGVHAEALPWPHRLREGRPPGRG